MRSRGHDGDLKTGGRAKGTGERRRYVSEISDGMGTREWACAAWKPAISALAMPSGMRFLSFIHASQKSDVDTL
jgi:hypothetical protein